MSTEAERESIREIMWPIANPVIVELGAHLGEDAEWLKDCCSQPPLHIMVEPEFRNVKRIVEQGLDDNRRLIVGAVASYSGSVTFNGSTTDNGVHGSGSIRTPTKHLELFPHVRFPEDMRKVVAAFTLDEIFTMQRLTRIDLLMVDVQGAEADMIRGGQHALARTRYLFMETETTELYEGMSLKDELLRMLPGWTLLAELDYNSLLRNEGFTE